MIMREDLQNPSPSKIIDLQYERRDGEADPDDVRLLLQLFCDFVDKGSTPPFELLQYLRDGFRDYLSGSRKLEAAVGLARRRGPPKTDEGTLWLRAAEVLRNRLAGQTYEQAVFKAAEDLGVGETVIKEAWEAHNAHALILLRVERHFDKDRNRPFSLEEQARIIDIYKDRQAKVAEIFRNEDVLGRAPVDSPEKSQI